MAFFLRSPRIDYRSREHLCTLLRDGRFIHSAPLVIHDRCAHAEGLENRSRELDAEWRAAKRAVIDDHAERGMVGSDGQGWTIPSTSTPDDIIARLNAAGAAVNSYTDPISALAGRGWDLCWTPLYSDRDDAPPCYVCGTPVTGKG